MNLSVLSFNFSTSYLINNLNPSTQTTINSILSNDTNIDKYTINTMHLTSHPLKLKPIHQIQPRKQRVSKVELTNNYIILSEICDLRILSQNAQGFKENSKID